MAWFSFASWKFSNETQTAIGVQELNSIRPIAWRRLFPVIWGYSNDTIMVAKSLYFLGPALKKFEPDLPNTYYIACGNALIALWAHVRGMECSLSGKMRYTLWTFACQFHSVVYEGFERVPVVRGKFGLWIIPAMVLSVTIYEVFIIAMGVLNYVIIGRVMKKADEGSTLYHRVEVSCEISSAIINAIL